MPCPDDDFKLVNRFAVTVWGFLTIILLINLLISYHQNLAHH